MCFYKKEEVDIEKWEVEDNFEIGKTGERVQSLKRWKQDMTVTLFYEFLLLYV